jgi:unsaturated rhamnogalacturonyl hydrolase
MIIQINKLHRRTNRVTGIMLALLVISTFTQCKTTPGTEKEVSETQSWHIRMLDSEIARNPEAWSLDFEVKPKWNYTHGLVLMATGKVWEQTQDERYFNYIKEYYDLMINKEGIIGHNYKTNNYNIDHIKPGINLFDLYEQTGDERYKTALLTLREQLKTHPRTDDGGYWHKKIYPYQLWLDGVYMNTPFYARYGKVFNEPENFDDVIHQITTVHKNTLDTVTGLLYHAYDEKRQQAWANQQTGHSPNFWGRAMGWYTMALVDAAEYFPADHPGIPQISEILKNLVDALVKYQDSETGLWYQVVDQMGREGNYLEASASSMFAYSIAKGVNNKLLDPSYMAVAEKAYKGIIDNLISIDESGYVNLNQNCAVAGLGGNPYRDGSYEYYISETIRSNDPKGVGPFMLLSMEMEKAGLNYSKSANGEEK